MSESIFIAMKLRNCQKQQVTRPAVVPMAATAILTSRLSLSARNAEVSSKLMHDVETNPGPCSGVRSFVFQVAIPSYIFYLSG